jgi:peptide-methionine (S)-S-oxide reductase
MHLYFNYNKKKENNKEIYFSMGCFWKSEELFWKTKGVTYTEVGYAECTVDNPSCADVFLDVDHREVVRVTYDPKLITIEELCRIFWKNHTSDLRDDFPVPNLYQSAVYVGNEDDCKSINSLKDIYKIEREHIGNIFPIRTKIKIINNYVIADESHQQYNLRN